MSASSTIETETESAFVCDCNHSMRDACEGEASYPTADGKRYCVLHLPAKEKGQAFYEALGRKIRKNDFDFRGVYFPEVNFLTTDFPTDANFSNATFSGRAAFTLVNFGGKAEFSNATFVEDAEFYCVTFKADAVFNSAIFNALADFNWSTFEGMASFIFTTFRDRVRFLGNTESEVFGVGSRLIFDEAMIETPERVSLHTLTLRPSFFIGVDARKFDLTNVDWDWRSIDEEIETLNKKISSPHRLLSRTCRQLAVNAEENHRYEEASKFRYISMDALRRERWRGFAVWRLSWWYWLASGYGERVAQAFLILLGILLLSALLYHHVGLAQWEPKPASANDLATAKRDEVGMPLSRTRALALQRWSDDIPKT